MVLKVANLNHDGSFMGWTYYDGIKTAAVYYETINKKIVACVDLISSPHSCVLTVDTESYLMNDNGKTLQVVFGGSDYANNR